MKSLAWQNEAACKGLDVNTFFLPFNARGENKEKLIAAAKAVCKGCPVQNYCLEYSLENEEVYGVWGGLSEEERRTLLLRRRNVVPVA